MKNAVIVPVGSKGGFYPKKLLTGSSRDDVFAAGREAYKIFISSLLSVTDNIVEGKVVRPGRTLCHDGEDPYFVVAADKGTATFSDTANAISQAHHFWLDDAFGNGMLLSSKIRLVAVFDHRDIFIDSDPDCASTFKERKRMFNFGRSSWQDYDRKELSKGGMIIPPSEKSVTLTAEAAEAIGFSHPKATPFEIITAILKADVDLLWFGGIGTYVKAAGESDDEVGDRTNDAVRITVREVGAKVIGEGANLGVTQLGRIEYNLNGGRCNCDAIDNSAGVNSSDVEVNIKIALATAMHDQRLTLANRNKLLESMTDEVAALVLRNNYLQTLAISLVERRSAHATGDLVRLMNRLESEGHLDRAVEELPNDQTLAERLSANKPLTRTEIGVLLSYAKIVLFDDLTSSTLLDDPYFQTRTDRLFPQAHAPQPWQRHQEPPAAPRNHRYPACQ